MRLIVYRETKTLEQEASLRLGKQHGKLRGESEHLRLLPSSEFAGKLNGLRHVNVSRVPWMTIQGLLPFRIYPIPPILLTGKTG